jgi:excisionase family DNA binding protein
MRVNLQKPTISLEMRERLDDRQLLSINEGAALLSVSNGMIRKFLERKQIHRYKLGKRTLISAKELLALVRVE